MKTVRLYSNERPALVDMLYAYNDTPRQAQSDISSLLVQNAEPRIVSGFTTTIAGQTLTVAAGSALLTFNSGNYLIKGLVVGADAGPQTFDLSDLGAGSYTVWVAFKALPSDLDARASSSAQQYGFEQNTNVYTRTSASFSVIVAQQSPGPDYASIAQVTLPSKTVTDARNLLFEGDAGNQFAHTWGSDADRSDDRGLSPISDLATMLDALKVAIEDIKGTHWWAATGAQGGNPGSPTFVGASKGHGPPDPANAVTGRSYYDLDSDTLWIAE